MSAFDSLSSSCKNGISYELHFKRNFGLENNASKKNFMNTDIKTINCKNVLLKRP